MRPFTRIGEAVISKDGCDYLLRPSFLNISRIGNPSEIVRVFSYVFDSYNLSCIRYAADKVNNKISGDCMILSLYSSLRVIQSCCDKRLPESITGNLTNLKMWQWQSGGITPNDLVILARHLLHFGMIGEEGDRSSEGDAESDGFDPMKFIAFASSPHPHGFGKTMADAEQMTMVQFQAIYEKAFPEVKAAKDKELAEFDASDKFDEMASIMAELEAQNGRSAG